MSITGHVQAYYNIMARVNSLNIDGNSDVLFGDGDQRRRNEEPLIGNGVESLQTTIESKSLNHDSDESPNHDKIKGLRNTDQAYPQTRSLGNTILVSVIAGMRRCGNAAMLLCGDAELYCIVLYLSIYIAPLNSHGQKETLLVQFAPRKETSFKN